MSHFVKYCSAVHGLSIRFIDSSMYMHENNRLVQTDLVILNEIGYLPFSHAGSALLFHLISKLHDPTNLIITINSSFSEWASVCRDPEMTTAFPDRVTSH
jgi:DNA replication protein DnaC